MSYLLGGTNGESNTFETVLANEALLAVHESSGLINLTNTVTPNSGNTYKVPSMGPLGFSDYDEAAGTGGDVQTASFGAKEITATPHVLPTEFGNFLLKTDAIGVAASVGSEIGMAFAEKADIVAAKAFSGFKATVGNTDYAASADGVTRPSALGALELLAVGDTASGAAASATVVALVRKVVGAWRKSRNLGKPVIVLGPEEADRLLAELTDPTKQLTPAGIELQSTGEIANLYGARVVFTTFLSSASRAVDGAAAADVRIGAAFGPMALTSVLVSGLEIAMGPKDGGLKTWLTGTGYFGAGVSDTRRGFAINIA